MNKKEKEELAKFLVGEYDKFCDEFLVSPEDLERFAKVYYNGWREYSFRNTIMAWIQCPEVSLMGGYRKWQSKGRQVMKGTKSIRIFAPNTRKVKKEVEGEEEELIFVTGFRLISVFDVSQTGVPKMATIPTGRSFDYLCPYPYDLTGVDVGAEEYITGKNNLKFEDFSKTSNLPVKIRTNLGFSNAQTGGVDIEVAKKKNELAMINSLFHEEIHVDMDHPGNKEISREVKEVCAEAGAYLVSTFFGIENTKAQFYIAGWGGDKEKLKGLGKDVIRSAERVIKLHLEGFKSLEGKVGEELLASA